MKTITLRDCPPQVAREIETRAKKQHTSLNRTVVGLLEEALGLKGAAREKRHLDMDCFIGKWTKEEADEFDKNLKLQRQIDPKMWK